jgi:hypothetical protein
MYFGLAQFYSHFLVWFGSVLTVTSSARTVRMTAGSSSALNVVSGEFLIFPFKAIFSLSIFVSLSKNLTLDETFQ